MSSKSLFKRFWYFIWEDESVWSWLFNVFLAFVIIKYMLFPGLGWILGSPAPIVAVVSGSMEHSGNFNSFWSGETCCNSACTSKKVQNSYYESVNITEDDFRSFAFVNGFNKGDIMILYDPSKSKLGDVIVYSTDRRPDPIIHRVIDVQVENGQTYYWTKGDHNCNVGAFEKKIPQNQVIGKALWRVPYLGWVKIVAVNFMQAMMG